MKRQILASIALIFCAAGIISGAEAFERSESAKNDFKRIHPCPANGNRRGPCPGYVIDHIQPLACGGADDPSNMQWQTEAEGKAKDKWERDACQRPAPSFAGASASGTTASNGDDTYHTGPRGGCYTYTSSGKKRYVSHDHCR